MITLDLRRWRVRIVVLLFVGAGCGALVHLFGRPSIRFDGVGYYAPLASVVFDGDLDLRNEVVYAHEWFQRSYFLRPDGTAVDPYAVGAAVLWAPVLWIARALDPAARAADRPRLQRSSPGFGPRYVHALALATGLEALLACGLLFWGLRAVASSMAAGLGVVGCALGTPLVYYALSEPSYSHTASFLACAALLVAVLMDREHRLPLPLLGALWGLATLVRWQDAVLGLMLAPRLVAELRALRRAPARTLAGLALFAAAAALVFWPQVFFWQRIYGRALVDTAPSGFMRWGSPQLLAMSFSTWHGAFVWSPLLLLGFAGLALVPERVLRWSLLGAVALEIYACAAASDWWGSGAFGPRRLTAVAPLAGLGLALLVARARSWSASNAPAVALVVVIALGTLWNLRLAQYNLNGLMPYNPEAQQDYVRHFQRDDPRAQRFGIWDYPRLAGEILEAERWWWQHRSDLPPH